jgi:hypothetical protein
MIDISMHEHSGEATACQGVFAGRKGLQGSRTHREKHLLHETTDGTPRGGNFSARLLIARWTDWNDSCRKIDSRKTSQGPPNRRQHGQVTRQGITSEFPMTRYSKTRKSRARRGCRALLFCLNTAPRLRLQAYSWSDWNRPGSTDVPSILTASRALGSRPKSCKMVGAT